MLRSNEPIIVAYLQKSVNQSILNKALVIEMVNNSFSERKARKTLVVRERVERFYRKK